jgi:hypothetical protein
MFLAGKVGYRPKVEAAIPGTLVLKVVRVCLENPNQEPGEREFFQSLIPLLARSIAESLAGLNDQDYADAINAASWASFYALDCPDGGRASGTLFLSSILWLQQVLENDYLVLAPGSAFDQAADKLIADIGRFERGNAEIYAKMEGAPRKLARRMQLRFEDLNLFVGAARPAQVAA